MYFNEQMVIDGARIARQCLSVVGTPSTYSITSGVTFADLVDKLVDLFCLFTESLSSYIVVLSTEYGQIRGIQLPLSLCDISYYIQR